LLYNCQSDEIRKIPFIEGYWEIVSVTKDQIKIKDFKISGTIDYFKINNDLSGFRKKVTPRFDGAFEMSQNQSNFNINIEDDKLWITYNNNGVVYREEVSRTPMNNSRLIISNRNGFVYNYKSYEPLIFELMSKRHNDKQNIEDLLKSFVKENKLEKGLDKVNVEAAWRDLMGNGVNSYTSNIKLHNNTLYVELSSSVLREELSYGKDKIIKMINESLGKITLSQISSEIKKKATNKLQLFL